METSAKKFFSLILSFFYQENLHEILYGFYEVLA